MRTLPAVPTPCTVEPLYEAVPLEYRVPFYEGQSLPVQPHRAVHKLLYCTNELGLSIK